MGIGRDPAGCRILAPRGHLLAFTGRRSQAEQEHPQPAYDGADHRDLLGITRDSYQDP